MTSFGKGPHHGEADHEAKYLSTITEKEEAERMSNFSTMSASTIFSMYDGRDSATLPRYALHEGKPRFQTGSIPEGSVVTNIPSRGISRISIPVDQQHDLPSNAVPTIPQNYSIPTLSPPPGFQPLQVELPNSSPPNNIRSPRSRATSLKSTKSAKVSFDDAGTRPEARNTLRSPQVDDSSTPAWPLPMPEKGSPRTSSSGSRDSQFSDLPSYPGTPGSRFSWPLKPQEVARSWFTRWFIEWWMFEILAWVFSVLCIAGIVVTLWYFNGRELLEWKLGITINAFIAIFAGFAKSALLVPTAEALGQLKWDWYQRSPKKMLDFEILDSASRGPWGSMMLLTRSKGITLASVGAAVILLSLPLDLFFQQIVSFPSVSVLQSSNATISRAVHYNPPGAAAIWNGKTTYRADWTMENAVIANMYKNSWDMEVDFNCPSKNCTWEPFHTLAVEGSCTEMPSSFLELGCYEVSGQWMSNVIPDPTQKNNTIPNSTTCGWYINPPDGSRELVTGYAVNNDSTSGEALTTRLFPLRNQFTRDAVFGGSINYPQHVKTTIQDFLIVASPGGAAGVYNNATPTVHECELHWELQLRQTTVKEDVLYEEIKQVVDLDFKETGQTQDDNPWVTMSWYGLNFSISLSDPKGPADLQFGMNNLTARRTIQALEEVIDASVTARNANALPVAKVFWRGTAPGSRALEDRLNPWLPPMNASEYISGIARAMTVAARRTGNFDDSQYDQVSGQAWDNRTLIKVKWIWITLPLALLLTSFLFLVATIVKSSKEETTVGIWKTSALAVLFNGLGQDVQDQPGAHDRLGQVRKKARKLDVTLGK